jgi:mono/diheme cytochrome c family protein
MQRQSKALISAAVALIMTAAFSASVFGDDLPTRTEGKFLYQKNCSGCHGDLEDSAKAGRSMNRIRTAIRTLHQDKMPATLTDEQILLIALVLKDVEN